MIEELYKLLKDYKDFMEDQDNKTRIAVTLTKEELNFMFTLIDTALLIAKLGGVLK